MSSRGLETGLRRHLMQTSRSPATPTQKCWPKDQLPATPAVGKRRPVNGSLATPHVGTCRNVDHKYEKLPGDLVLTNCSACPCMWRRRRRIWGPIIHYRHRRRPQDRPMFLRGHRRRPIQRSMFMCGRRRRLDSRPVFGMSATHARKPDGHFGNLRRFRGHVWSAMS